MGSPTGTASVLPDEFAQLRSSPPKLHPYWLSVSPRKCTRKRTMVNIVLMQSATATKNATEPIMHSRCAKASLVSHPQSASPVKSAAVSFHVVVSRPRFAYAELYAPCDWQAGLQGA